MVRRWGSSLRPLRIAAARTTRTNAMVEARANGGGGGGAVTADTASKANVSIMLRIRMSGIKGKRDVYL